MGYEPGKELSSIDFKSMIGGPLTAVIEAQAQAAMSSINFIKSVGFKPTDPKTKEPGDPIYVTFKYPKELSPYKPKTTSILSVIINNGGTGYGVAPAITTANGGATFTAVLGKGSITAVQVTSQGDGKYTDAPPLTITPAGGDPGKGLDLKVMLVQAYSDQQAAVIEDQKLEVPILTMLPIPFIRIQETTIDFNAKINSVETRDTSEDFKVAGTLEAAVNYWCVSAKISVSASYQKTTTEGSKVDKTYSLAIHVRAVQEEMPAGMEKILSIIEGQMRSQPVYAPDPIKKVAA